MTGTPVGSTPAPPQPPRPPQGDRKVGELVIDVTERVMGIMRSEPVQRRNTIQLEAHTAGFIDGPFEEIRLTIPDRIERRQDVEPRVSVELGGENVGLQVLVEGLAQHLFIEMDAVEPGPGGG